MSASHFVRLNNIALHVHTSELRDVICRLPYAITQCYLPPNTSERAPPNHSQNGWCPINLPQRDGRLSWPRWLVIPRWFTRPQTVTHPSINRARRRVTTLIGTSVPPLSRATTCVRLVWMTEDFSEACCECVIDEACVACTVSWLIRGTDAGTWGWLCWHCIRWTCRETLQTGGGSSLIVLSRCPCCVSICYCVVTWQYTLWCLLKLHDTYC